MRKLLASCASLALVAGLTACGSSGGGSSNNGSGTSGTSGGGGTIKVGMITDLSGPALSSSEGSKEGAQAYLDYINSKGGVNGQKIQMVVADTQSTPTGALTAAQKLVQQDHVLVVLADTPLFFGAEQYLLKAKVPVVGNAVDGPEWYDPKSTNLFNASGIFDYHYAIDALGQLFKSEGVTSCGAVGTGGIQSVQISGAGDMQACEDAGLKKGFTNYQLPLGSTDMAPVALQIKNSGVDGVISLQGPSSSFALAKELNQLGVHLKAFVFTVGYGADLLSQPASVSAAQGVIFNALSFPNETNNAATVLRRTIMKKANLPLPLNAGQNYGYLNAVALVEGLKVSGANPSGATFTTKMRAIKNYNANGLLPSTYNFSDFTPPDKVCQAFVKLTGKKFVPVSPMPICGGTKKVG